MFKVVILFAVVAAASANPVATPLIGRLVPQPALAPANTEHAGYVSGLTPIVREVILSQPLYSAPYSGPVEQIPLPGVLNYVAIAAPLRAFS